MAPYSTKRPTPIHYYNAETKGIFRYIERTMRREYRKKKKKIVIPSLEIKKMAQLGYFARCVEREGKRKRNPKKGFIVCMSEARIVSYGMRGKTKNLYSMKSFFRILLTWT